MSDTYNNAESGQPAGKADLDLGGPVWVPTQPADTYTGPQPDESGYLPPAFDTPAPASQPSQPLPGYGQSLPAAEPSDYQVYGSTPAPVQPVYAPPAYVVAPVYVPGQVVQTPYGMVTVGNRSKLTAGLLGIFLGGLGVGRFYRGNVGIGLLQILVTVVTWGVGWLWGLIDGILVLVAQPGTPASLDGDKRLMT